MLQASTGNTGKRDADASNASNDSIQRSHLLCPWTLDRGSCFHQLLNDLSLRSDLGTIGQWLKVVPCFTPKIPYSFILNMTHDHIMTAFFWAQLPGLRTMRQGGDDLVLLQKKCRFP